MASLVEDLRRGFLARNGAIGQLILANVVIYLLFVIPGVFLFLAGAPRYDQIAQEYLTLPSDLGTLLVRPWTPITYQFLHSLRDTLHLLFNMLTLYWMGRLLREYQGDRKVWNLYLLGGLVAGLLFVLAYNLFPGLAMDRGAYLLGASGAVMAIVVGTATLLPDFTFFLLFFGPVRLKWIAVILVLLNFIGISQGNAGGMIAHLGGALFGYVYMTLVKQGTDLGAPLNALRDFLHRRRDRSARNIRVASRSTPKAVPGSPSEDEINRILDKIRAVGYDKLTTEEKQTLFNASNQK